MTRFASDSGSSPLADLDLTRRNLFKAAPAIGVVATTPPLSANALSAHRHQRRIANVTAFGAKGDGVANDYAAFRAALAQAQVVEVPPGTFRIDRPLVIGDGQVVRGAGPSGWEPYTGRGGPQSATKSEIVIEAGLAFDARGSNNAAISGLAIRAKDAQQSGWARAPGTHRGTTGIDIAGALQFNASNISFHGLEVAVSSTADSGDAAQMPRIGEWSAHDCATVFRFVSGNGDVTPVRDARIDGCIAALHCGRIVEARNCDGLRIENVRFYQCLTNSLLIENTPFVAITGATMFETGEDALVLRGCSYASISGMLLARAGFFHPKPLLQRAAVVLDNCNDLSFDGVIEQPTGRAFAIRNCSNLSLKAAIGTPFWSIGSLGNNDGAVHVQNSRAIAIDASFGGSDYWMAVWSDAASAPWISGHIAGNGTAGVVRCVAIQPAPLGHVIRTPTAGTVAANGTVKLDELRILVPPGKSLVSRSVELTASGFAILLGQQRWRMETPEPGGGGLSLERKVLFHNNTAQPQYAGVPVGVHNPTSAPLPLPAGHEVRLSLAFE